jgi:hypothetical protein
MWRRRHLGDDCFEAILKDIALCNAAFFSVNYSIYGVANVIGFDVVRYPAVLSERVIRMAWFYKPLVLDVGIFYF